MAYENLLEHVKDYGVQHKAFVQAVMFRRFVEVQDAPGLFVQACVNSGLAIVKPEPRRSQQPTQVDRQGFLNALLEACNERLPRVGFRLVIVTDERSADREWLVLISEQHFSQKFAELAVSGFTSDEFAIFKFWLRLMFSAPENDEGPGRGEISLTDALNEARNVHEVKPERSQRLLDKLVTKKWIEIEEEDGLITLHPCAVGELEMMLKMAYDLPVCNICNHPILMRRFTVSCAEEQCDGCYHAVCLRKQQLPFKCNQGRCKNRITDADLPFD